jgi:hypothetical protein
MLSLKIGDVKANSRMAPYQIGVICTWQRDPESNGTCRERGIAMLLRRELQSQTQFVAIESDGLFEVRDEDVHVRDLHGAFSCCLTFALSCPRRQGL